MSKSREYALIAGIAILLVGLGYSFGRYAAPDKVVVTEKVVTVEKQVVVTQVKTEVQVVKVADVQKDVHKTKTTETKKDGTVIVTEKTDDNTKTEVKTDTDKNKVDLTVKEKVVTQDREVTKLVERDRPKWSATLMPGLDVGGIFGFGNPYSLLPGNTVLKRVLVGVSVEHQFIGPISLGVWANTHAAAGLSLRLDW